MNLFLHMILNLYNDLLANTSTSNIYVEESILKLIDNKIRDLSNYILKTYGQRKEENTNCMGLNMFISSDF